MKKFTAAAFMFLICTTELLSTTAQIQRATLRCKCPKTHSKPQIPIKNILSLKVFAPGPQCNKEEIIATLKKGQTCLDPNTAWVISLKEIYNRNDTRSN